MLYILSSLEITIYTETKTVALISMIFLNKSHHHGLSDTQKGWKKVSLTLLGH